MKKTLSALVCLLIGLLVSNCATPPRAAFQTDAKHYQMLVKETQDGGMAVDFTKLRMDYANSKYYTPSCALGVRATMRKAFQGKRYEDALEAAEILLNGCPYDIEAHMISASVYGKKNNPTMKKYHLAYAKGVIDSILGSGDGAKPESAYKVISTFEEYGLLVTFGYRFRGRKLVSSNGHSYDLLTVSDQETGKESEIYFNIDTIATFQARQPKWQPPRPNGGK